MNRNYPVLYNRHVGPLLEKGLTDKIIGARLKFIERLVPVCLNHRIKYAWNMKAVCGRFLSRGLWICL